MEVVEVARRFQITLSLSGAHCREACQDCNVDARVGFLTSSGFIRQELVTLKQTTEITYLATPIYIT